MQPRTGPHPSHKEVWTASNINYDQPLTPLEVAGLREKRAEAERAAMYPGYQHPGCFHDHRVRRPPQSGDDGHRGPQPCLAGDRGGLTDREPSGASQRADGLYTLVQYHPC
ncbi:hypothetical protein ACOMHN_017932 [Nucella lapillus]